VKVVVTGVDKPKKVRKAISFVTVMEIIKSTWKRTAIQRLLKKHKNSGGYSETFQ
jgi:hypothetical protein